MRGGHVAEGLAHIEHALKLNPNAARAWELCGRVCSRLGQHGRSIECFEKAMRLSPLDPMAVWQYVGIAWPYFLTGRHDEAIAWADKAARVMPNISQPWRIMLAAGALAGRDEVVEQALRRLRDIVPDVSIAKLLGTNQFRPRISSNTTKRLSARPECRNDHDTRPPRRDRQSTWLATFSGVFPPAANSVGIFCQILSTLMFAVSSCRHGNSLLIVGVVQHGRRWAWQEARS